MKNILIVANSNSGSYPGDEYFCDIKNKFISLGYNCEFYNSEFKSDAEMYCKKYGKNFDYIIAGGGDGTINEVIQGMKYSDYTLGILPFGTANVLAKTFKIDKESETLIKSLKNNNIIKMDIFTANDRLFLALLSYGLDSFAVETLNETLKKYTGKLSYVISFVKYLFKRDIPEIELVTGDNRIISKQIIISNVKNYGGDFQLSNKICYDDALLDVFCFKSISIFNFVKLLGAVILKRNIEKLNFINYLKTDEIKITSKSKLPVQFDGDRGLYTDIKIKFLKKINLLVPDRF